MDFSNVSTVPPNDVEFLLAMNVATSDGSVVSYDNFEFWQSTTELGTAEDDPTVAFERDYKNLHIFSSYKAAYLLVVVHSGHRGERAALLLPR